VYDEVRNFVEQIRPNLSFHLTLLGYREKRHKDRFVATNYSELSSNDSFAFFQDGELKKETKIIHLPSSKHGTSTFRQLKRIAELSENPPCVADYHSEERGGKILLAAGDNINRLLDHVRQQSAEV
jgi:hypothetical protein